jgi:tetratricopeptide (TPR) repeat protein
MTGTRSGTSTPDRRSARRPAPLLLLALLALGFASAAAAQDHTTSHAAESLGHAHFPVSCSPAAQAEFDRALAMLHSFWFPQATVAFTGATRTDPDCAMAHWGIAMSQRGNPLVGAPAPAALKAGWAAVEKAKALGARTPRERDYVAAMESYYKDADTIDHATRVLAYEAAMAQVHARHPADLEAATLYALAMNEAILVLPPDKTYARHQAAAQLLETVLAGQPDHPGALHYLIHSYDFPVLAARGLPAARRYETVASSAPHALHMPSHIFSMLGMWEESIRSNRAALGVAKTYVHAVDFTVYAHLQQAQDEAARALVDETAALLRTQAPAADLTPTAGILAVHTAFAAVPARYAIERGAWAEAAALPVRSSTPAADAVTHFARAMGTIRSGNAAAARPDMERLDAIRDTLTQSKQEYWAEQVEIQRLAATAWIALADGRSAEALRLMREAADREDASEKHVAMENRLWPMRELLGELLLELKQPALALPEFEASLQAARNRFRGLSGAARAAELSGNRARAREYYRQLLTLAGGSDAANRAELRQARAFVSQP